MGSEMCIRDRPRLKASIPTLPVPANISNILALLMSEPIILNKASLTRSVIGRVMLASTCLRRTPRAFPDITLILLKLPICSTQPFHVRLANYRME